MAYEEHFKIIKQGKSVWNEWREKHPEIKPDLSGANLSGDNLRGAHLNDTDLSDANLRGACLRSAYLGGADLKSANLSGADLSGAHLNGAYLRSADLSDARLSDTDLSEVNLRWADLSGAYLKSANLRSAYLSKADLSDANLSGANLSGAHLSGANLSSANLKSANLSGANLSGAYLSDTDLSSANLDSADLRSAYLGGAYLRSANLSGADFSDTTVDWTIVGDIDLRQTKGLETINHYAPSTIGIDTLMRSQGNIPDVFLKGAGVSDEIIKYAKSLTRRAIEYYTCFICYSSKDQDFAERLYADLQSNGVRCWYAPEELKPGDFHHYRIDESIRVYDKLLLILSQHSIKSEGVEKEVKRACEKEDQMDMNRQVLFPIRIDDAIMSTGGGWANLLQRSRFIRDFTRWKEHDAYQANFQRLLQDLQATST